MDSAWQALGSWSVAGVGSDAILLDCACACAAVAGKPTRTDREVRSAGHTITVSSPGWGVQPGRWAKVADAHRRPAVGDPEHVETVMAALLAPGAGTHRRPGHHRRPQRLRAWAIDGRVRVTRSYDGHGWAFTEVEVEGETRWATKSTTSSWGLTAEQANPWPHRTTNAYPHAYEMVARSSSPPCSALCDHPAYPCPQLGIPWLARSDTASAISIIQARAPFSIWRAGVQAQGMAPRSAVWWTRRPPRRRHGGHASSHGVGLNGRTRPDAACRGARRRGARWAVRSAGAARARGWVPAGRCNPHALYDAVANGDAPTSPRPRSWVWASSTGVLVDAHGDPGEPHTSILTGHIPATTALEQRPGMHRRLGEQVITNSPAMWPWSMASLSPEVETLAPSRGAMWPGLVTLAANEPCDTGATVGTFGLLRAGGMPHSPPKARTCRSPRSGSSVRRRHATASRIDHVGMELALGVWGDGYQGCAVRHAEVLVGELLAHGRRALPPRRPVVRSSPRLDPHHTDARIGHTLDAVERRGASSDRTAVLPGRRPLALRSPPGGHGRDPGPRVARHRRRTPRRGLHVDLRRGHRTPNRLRLRSTHASGKGSGGASCVWCTCTRPARWWIGAVRGRPCFGHRASASSCGRAHAVTALGPGGPGHPPSMRTPPPTRFVIVDHPFESLAVELTIPGDSSQRQWNGLIALAHVRSRVHRSVPWRRSSTSPLRGQASGTADHLGPVARSRTVAIACCVPPSTMRATSPCCCRILRRSMMVCSTGPGGCSDESTPCPRVNVAELVLAEELCIHPGGAT